VIRIDIGVFEILQITLTLHCDMNAVSKGEFLDMGNTSEYQTMVGQGKFITQFLPRDAL